MSLKPEIAKVLAAHKVARFEAVEPDAGPAVLRTDIPVSKILLNDLFRATGRGWINEPIPSMPAPEAAQLQLPGIPEALKHDNNKPLMGLISSRFLKGLAQVLTFGASKYAAHNWRKGFALSRPYNALQRHLTDWNDGKDLDEETKLPLLYHAACELMFLAELAETHPHLDDRYKDSAEIKVSGFHELRAPREGVDQAVAIGEWVTVEIEGKDVAAFVPQQMVGKQLPTQIFYKAVP